MIVYMICMKLRLLISRKHLQIIIFTDVKSRDTKSFVAFLEFFFLYSNHITQITGSAVVQLRNIAPEVIWHEPVYDIGFVGACR